MSESLLASTSNFKENLKHIRNLPVSSNAKVNELLGIPEITQMEEIPKHFQLKSIVKKSGRHLKKSTWSEYLKNNTRKNVKFNPLTKVLRYDDEKGMRSAKETLEDLMTDTIQQVKIIRKLNVRFFL